MKYVPERIIMWECLSEERREEIEEIEGRRIGYLEGELKENYIETDKCTEKIFCIFINKGHNYCYYDNETEKEILAEIEKAGIDIEEVSIRFDEYIIREVVE